MSGPLTAGEPLVPPIPPAPPTARRSRSGGQPPRPPRGRRPRGVFATIGLFIARVFGILFGLGALAGLVGAVFAWQTYQRYAADLPSVDGLRHYQPRVMSRVYAGDSRPIAELATERRIFVPYTAIPEIVTHAFISAEDQKFWTHKGVDPAAIARAGLMDLQQWGQGRRPVGASTITQQLAKNMLLGNEVSIARKVKEILLARRIEESLTKERILELYLNEIYLGLGSYGVAAAAQTYFNKTLDELTVAEAAFLAVLPKAPNNYNPFRNPDAAKARRDWVLDRMAENRAITPEQARDAKAQPIDAAPFRRPDMVPGSEWFSEEVRRQLIEYFGQDVTTGGGLTVRTSLDPVLQATADKSLRAGLMNYDRTHSHYRGPVTHLGAAPTLKASWPGMLAQVARTPGMLADWRLGVVLEGAGAEAKAGWLDTAPGVPAANAQQRISTLSTGGWGRRVLDTVKVGDVVMMEVDPAKPDRAVLRQIPQVQGALVAVEPQTGRVLAMSGGWSYESSQFNRVTQAQRQPGSSFKPMVYLTALEHNISPSQKFLDGPFTLNLGREGTWSPGNYDGSFNGMLPMRIALEKSLNLVTVRIADTVGMKEVAKTAIAFHVVDQMPLVLPASLGAVETTVLRQAGAYASLAMGGKEVVPHIVDLVQDRDGHAIWKAPGLDCQGCADPTRPPTLLDKRKQIADPQSVFQMVTMMQGVVQHGTGFSAAQGLNRTDIAGKTGTTQDAKDAWFVGFTPDLVVAVWVGFDEPQSLGEKETGGGLAAPIWRDFMGTVLKNRPNLPFVAPDGVKLVAWDTGYGSRTDAFKTGQEPGASSAIASASANSSTEKLAGASGGGSLAAPRMSIRTSSGDDSDMGGLY